jgi:glucose/arabinose dehydrogenase
MEDTLTLKILMEMVSVYRNSKSNLILVIISTVFFCLNLTAQKKELPPPYATKSARNLSKVVGWKEGEKPVAPPGFKVQAFGKDYFHPRWIFVLPNGDVLVAETKKEPKGLEKAAKVAMGNETIKKDEGQRISILRDKNGDGTPEMQGVFLRGLNLPFGMALIEDRLYVACTDAVLSFPYHEGDTAITAEPKKILDLPARERHWTKNLITNRDGSKLYIAVGSSSDVGENGMDKEKRRACIIEINPDGSGEKIYASGLRNPVGMDWQPGTNILWTAVNERDELGDDLVPDYLTSVKEGGFYGWPYCYWGQNIEPRIKKEEQKPDLVNKAIVPDVDLGPHTASLGLDFYTGNMFPAMYKNAAFVGQHGSWNRSVPTGYKVVYVPFTKGKPGEQKDFLTGFMVDAEKNTVHGRPVGVTETKDGSLLVADDDGNMIWRVSYEGK